MTGERRLAGRPFARAPDAYAGADLGNARRMIAVVWALSTAITVIFLALSPPTEPLGDSGWAIAALILVAGVVGTRLVAGKRHTLDFDSLLLVSYAGVLQVALLSWLAGGSDPLYNSLLVLWVCTAAGAHPVGRAILFICIATLTAAAPALYAGGTEQMVLGDVLLTAAAGSLVLALMTTVRKQRLGLRAEREEARELSLADALTGVGNRRAFDEAIRSEIGRTRRAGSPLSLALMDLDGFKEINDRLGHVAGDACLRSFAESVRDTIRTGDRCFRWGGDELVVLFPDTPIVEAQRVCVRIRAAVRTSSTEAGEELQVSYGVAELAPGTDDEGLVRAADAALMTAKAERHSAASGRFVRARGAE